MKKALIVVDMQNDFIDGSLGFKDAYKIIDPIIKKIEEHSDADLIFTLDTHYDNYLSTEEGYHLPVIHCIDGSFGHKIHKKLETYFKKAKVFKKNTFGSLELANYLHEKGYEEVHIMGLVSNICVISQAILAKSALENAKIYVDTNTTDSYDKDLNESVIKVLRGLQFRP